MMISWLICVVLFLEAIQSIKGAATVTRSGGELRVSWKSGRDEAPRPSTLTMRHTLQLRIMFTAWTRDLKIPISGSDLDGAMQRHACWEHGDRSVPYFQAISMQQLVRSAIQHLLIFRSGHISSFPVLSETPSPRLRPKSVNKPGARPTSLDRP